MNTFISNALDLNPVLQQLVSGALADDTYERVFENLCNGLLHAGLPLLRTHLTTQTLHPLVAAVDLTWIRERGLEVRGDEHSATENDSWLQSPMHWMLSYGQTELHQSLARGADYFTLATTSRLESLTKQAGEPLLVSRAFRELLDISWRDLGIYSAKGVS